MQDHELRAIIRAKNAAWDALRRADLRCLAYQRTRANGDGYPELPPSWEEKRAHLREAYRDVRAQYVWARRIRRSGR